MHQSRIGILHARRRLAAPAAAAELRAAPAERLPFAAATCDLVVSIGMVTCVGSQPFLAEAARVPALTGGTTDTPLGWTRAVPAGHGRVAGLERRAFEGIPARLFAAIRHQAPATEAAVSRVPGPLRRHAGEWAALPGSRRHAPCLEGRRQDVTAVFARAG